MTAPGYGPPSRPRVSPGAAGALGAVGGGLLGYELGKTQREQQQFRQDKITEQGDRSNHNDAHGQGNWVVGQDGDFGDSGNPGRGQPGRRMRRLVMASLHLRDGGRRCRNLGSAGHCGGNETRPASRDVTAPTTVDCPSALWVGDRQTLARSRRVWAVRPSATEHGPGGSRRSGNA